MQFGCLLWPQVFDSVEQLYLLVYQQLLSLVDESLEVNEEFVHQKSAFVLDKQVTANCVEQSAD